MGIISRTNEPSGQRMALDVCLNGSQTNGETGVICHIPTACLLEAANFACYNTTSQAYMMLTLNRFIVGTGATTYVLGSTFAPPVFGTSGVIPSGVSLPATGNSLLALMPNDVIGYQIGGGSTAAIYGIAGTVVIRPLQDIRSYLAQV